jgi:hypothetical protein
VAKGRESADRRQRERAKQQKANAKRERRLNKNAAPEEGEGDEPDAPESPVEKVDEEQLLAELAQLHAAFDNDEISFDDFELRREDLLSKLQVD